MFMVLVFSLAKLTIVDGEDYLELSENRKRKTVAIQGTRGSIMDRNGLPLAYDEKSFNVSVVKDPTVNSTAARTYYTDIFIKTIDIVESRGGTIIDTFVIKRDDDGNFYFDFGIENAEAKKRAVKKHGEQTCSLEPSVHPKKFMLSCGRVSLSQRNIIMSKHENCFQYGRKFNSRHTVLMFR